jgi:hypothetical protein
MTITPVNDLRHMFGAARDQGSRPTCLAFAASDTHAAVRGNWAPLSCEYAFYKAQQRGNRAVSTGAVLSDMLAAVREDGQPVESGWAYLNPPIDPKTWSPPANIAPLFKRGSETRQNSVDEIIARLDQGHPVLVLTTISASFYKPMAASIVDHNEAADLSRRHAVVAVAHGANEGQRVILMRNSWGAGWGASGYAWLTEKYLVPRVFQLAILKEDLSVSANSAAA